MHAPVHSISPLSGRYGRCHHDECHQERCPCSELHVVSLIASLFEAVLRKRSITSTVSTFSTLDLNHLDTSRVDFQVGDVFAAYPRHTRVENVDS